MKKTSKIICILVTLIACVNFTYAATTVGEGINNLSVNWPYYIAVALIMSSFVTFSLIIVGTANSNKKKKKVDEGTKKYLITIAIIQLLIVSMIPVIVLINYFNYKPFRQISLVSPVWSETTNINLLNVKIYGKNWTPENGIEIKSEKEKIELLKIISNFQMKPKGIPQLVQRTDLTKWYGQSVEITNMVTGRKVVLEYDSPYCCINNVEYKSKDGVFEKELNNFIENKLQQYAENE